MSLTCHTTLRATLTGAVLLVASLTSAQTAGELQPPPAFVVAPFDTNRTGWMPPPRLGDHARRHHGLASPRRDRAHGS